ncbi:MAG: branched-chain amino acid ABC transporter ATP-binding protein [Acidimicrobiia bacterium]
MAGDSYRFGRGSSSRHRHRAAHRALGVARRAPRARHRCTEPRPRAPRAPQGTHAFGLGSRAGAGVDRRTCHGGGPAVTEPILSVRGLDVRYGPARVLFGVDLDVTEGEICALVGTNGAGKSTLLRAVAGLVRPSRGCVHFAGTDVTGWSADRLARAGMALMPGGRGIFPGLRVVDNLRLAGWIDRRRAVEVAAARDAVLELFPVLRDRLADRAGDLSGGQQQMLALACTLMTRPRMLLIDELSLGLAPTVVAQLLEVVRELNRRGTTIVLVEQSVETAMQVAARAVFMEKGAIRYDGSTATLLERPDILRSVFLAGGDSDHRRSQGPRPRAAPVLPALECHGLTRRFGGITAVDAVDLTVPPGRILGLIGHNGAGKTTLLDCLSGLLPADAGRVLVGGTDVSGWPAHRRALAGLGRSFQHALLYPSLTVAETVAVARERHIACRTLLADALALPASYESELDVAARVDAVLEACGLGPYRDRLCAELSTGTRRLVELACLLAQEARVVLLDEPSAGVAQRETEALGPLLRNVRDRTGCAMVVVEHDMGLVRSLCDELVALELGAVIARGSPAQVLAHPRVVASYLGSPGGTTPFRGVRSTRRSPARVGTRDTARARRAGA